MANKNPNTEHLIKNSELTPKERKEKASKAGKASVEAKRRKKTMREVLEMLMYDVELDEQTKERLRGQGVKNPEDFNHQTVINRSLIAKAEAGDVQAYNTICAMLNEKPADKMEVTGDILKNIRVERIGSREDSGLIASSEDEIAE